MRIVPVQLQHGKFYVTRGGETVQVLRRSLRESNPYTFMDADERVTFQADGREFMEGESNMDIVRPAYAVGERYASRDSGMTVLLTNEQTGSYPLVGACGDRTCIEYTSEGRYWSGTNPGDHEDDLMDYAPQEEVIKLAGRKATLVITDDVSEDKTMQVGSHVSFRYDGSAELTGVIRYIDTDNHAAVELDDIIDIRALPFNPWDCNGRVPSKRGWFMPVAELSIVPEGWGVAETATEAAPAAAPAMQLLDRGDRKLLWDMYWQSRRTDSVSMGELIALRRELDAACER